MQRLESKSVVVDGIKVKYLSGGKGPVLCFIQGWGKFEAYVSIFTALSKHFRIVAPDIWDLRNKLKQPFYNNYVKIISAALKQIEFKGILAGHSFGGALAAGIAVKTSVKKLFLIDSAGIPVQRGKLKWIFIYTREVYRESNIEKGKNSLGKHLAAFLIANLHPRTYRVSREIMYLDAREVFKKVQQPAMIIWGRDDFVFPITAATAIKKLMKNSTVVTVEGMHNWCILQPERLSRILQQKI